MMIRRLVPIIAAVSLGFAVAVTWLLTPSSGVTAPPNQPARSTLKEGRIAGLGIVEPRGECVAVGSAVPGIVDMVLVKPGDTVKEGQPLFKLEQAERQAEVEARMAALQLEESKLARLEAQPRPEDVSPLEARVRAAEVESKRAEGTFERVKTARDAGAASVEDMEQRRFNSAIAELMKLTNALTDPSSCPSPDARAACARVLLQVRANTRVNRLYHTRSCVK